MIVEVIRCGDGFLDKYYLRNIFEYIVDEL